MTDPDDTEPTAADHRVIGILLAVVAIGALGFALVTQRWLLSPGGGTGFGLRETFTCGQADCVTRPNAEAVLDFASSMVRDDREHAAAIFPALGWVTSVLIAIGMLGLAIAAVAAAARKRPHWPISPTTIALLPVMIALVTGFVFLATKPGDATFVGVAIGFWVFGGGEICAVIASLLLTRAIRPPDPDLTADAMNPDEF